MEEHNNINPMLNHLFGTDEDADTTSFVAIKERASLKLGEFAEYISAQLNENNIHLPPPMTFVSEAGKAVELISEHPQKELVENWMKQSIGFMERFKKVELMYEMVRAIEHAGEAPHKSARFQIGITSLGPIAFFEELH